MFSESLDLVDYILFQIFVAWVFGLSQFSHYIVFVHWTFLGFVWFILGLDKYLKEKKRKKINQSFIWFSGFYFFVMAFFRPKSKACESCSQEMHPMDRHPYCLECLTPTHDSGVCDLCKEICYSIYSVRLEIVGDALLAHKWPQGWRVKLRTSEDSVWSTPSNDSTVGNASPASSHGDDQVEDLVPDTNVKVSIPSDQEWRASMEATMAGLGNSMKSLSESLHNISQSAGSDKKRKTKSEPQKSKPSKKSKMVVVDKKIKVHAKTNTAPSKESTNTDVTEGTSKTTEHSGSGVSNPEDVLKAHGFSLESVFQYAQQRPPPPTKIPKTSSVCGESVSSRGSINRSVDGDQEFEHEDEEDLGRGEKRKMFLQGLRNLVPELQHAPMNEEMPSGHFSLLHIKQKTDKMPFLAEIFHQVAKSTDNQVRRRDFLKKVTHLYPTTQPAEGGLLKPRVIPKQLRPFVPASALQEPGASGFTARLKQNTLEGLKESLALASHDYATANLRLSNNLEIGVEVCNTLIEQNRGYLDEFKTLELPVQAKVALFQLNKNMTLLNNTVYDMKSSNNDFLNLSLNQYNKSLSDRRDAWVDSTNLAAGVKKELKSSEHVSPQLTDQPDTRICMLGSVETKALEEHQQILKDQFLLNSWQNVQGFRPNNQRGQFNRRGNQGRGSQGYQGNYGNQRNSYQNQGNGYHNQANSRNNSGRGRGRGNNRGNFRPRGDQDNKQPFSESKSLDKVD